MLMVRLPITEWSAKVRTGGPIDEPEDMGEPVWAGQIPVWMATGPAVPDGPPRPGVDEPSYVRAYPVRGAGPGTGTVAPSPPSMTAPRG